MSLLGKMCEESSRNFRISHLALRTQKADSSKHDIFQRKKGGLAFKKVNKTYGKKLLLS